MLSTARVTERYENSRFGERLARFDAPRRFRSGSLGVGQETVDGTWSQVPEDILTLLPHTALKDADPGDILSLGVYPYAAWSAGQEQPVRLRLWWMEARSPEILAKLRPLLKPGPNERVLELHGVLMVGVDAEGEGPALLSVRDELPSAAREHLIR